MKKDKSGFQDVYKQLISWIEEAKNHKLSSTTEVIEQAKKILLAAEQIPEQQLKQFVENLRYDLKDFYHQYQADVKHSIYLELLNERLWANLAQVTDKSQVEWAELVEDFQHDGIYHAGDHIGFGELQCQKCQHSVTYTHANTIADCILCGSDTFSRQSLTP